jgi:hypothetical protein
MAQFPLILAMAVVACSHGRDLIAVRAMAVTAIFFGVHRDGRKRALRLPVTVEAVPRGVVRLSAEVMTRDAFGCFGHYGRGKEVSATVLYASLFFVTGLATRARWAGEAALGMTLGALKSFAAHVHFVHAASPHLMPVARHGGGWRRR